jgi:hypothetical protein
METTMSETATRPNSEATPEGHELRDDGWDLMANKVHA